jgi:hypothetical protein
MKPTYVTAIAFALLVIGRWAHGKPGLNIQTVAGAAFVIIVIAALEAGPAEDIATYTAWILLAVVALSANSPISAISNVINNAQSGKVPAGERGGPSA